MLSRASVSCSSWVLPRFSLEIEFGLHGRCDDANGSSEIQLPRESQAVDGIGGELQGGQIDTNLSFDAGLLDLDNDFRAVGQSSSMDLRNGSRAEGRIGERRKDFSQRLPQIGFDDRCNRGQRQMRQVIQQGGEAETISIGKKVDTAWQGADRAPQSRRRVLTQMGPEKFGACVSVKRSAANKGNRKPDRGQCKPERASGKTQGERRRSKAVVRREDLPGDCANLQRGRD